MTGTPRWVWLNAGKMDHGQQKWDHSVGNDVIHLKSDPMWGVGSKSLRASRIPNQNVVIRVRLGNHSV